MFVHFFGQAWLVFSFYLSNQITFFLNLAMIYWPKLDYIITLDTYLYTSIKCIQKHDQLTRPATGCREWLQEIKNLALKYERSLPINLWFLMLLNYTNSQYKTCLAEYSIHQWFSTVLCRSTLKFIFLSNAPLHWFNKT